MSQRMLTDPLISKRFMLFLRLWPWCCTTGPTHMCGWGIYSLDAGGQGAGRVVFDVGGDVGDDDDGEPCDWLGLMSMRLMTTASS